LVEEHPFMTSPLPRLAAVVLGLSSLHLGCGGNKPPPKTEETAKDDNPRRETQGGGPSVSQELGSIDQRAVEQTFDKLQTKLETCHTQGRQRIEYLSGDVKVFLRIDPDGRVKYSFFDESTLGDRETERCILDLFGATSWPKPQGGEAEVRNGFGWPAGGERQPTPWGPEKVTAAIDDDTKKAVEKCKGGLAGDFRITAYVEPGEAEGSQHGTGAGAGKSTGKGGAKGGGKSAGAAKKPSKGEKRAAPKATEHGGRFKAIGVAPPGKEGAERIECVVEAIRGLSLPSPGSYPAKVIFTL
jgi:hypothetical protein